MQGDPALAPIQPEHLPGHLDEFVFQATTAGEHRCAAFQTLLGLGVYPPSDDVLGDDGSVEAAARFNRVIPGALLFGGPASLPRLVTASRRPRTCSLGDAPPHG